MPERIQRRRTKGRRMPAGAVYVGRPGPFGNLYGVEEYGREEAIRLYRKWLTEPEAPERAAAVRALLAGKDLACWCPIYAPCHADVLLEVANG